MPNEPTQPDQPSSLWDEVSLAISREMVPDIERVLQEHGALAITLLDHADQPVLEPAPGAVPLWREVQIKGLFSRGIDRDRISLGLLMTPGFDRPEEMDWQVLEDQDWERAWMDRFQPMQFGEKLWIVPTGMKQPDDPQACVIHLDPGLAFGTGTHPTTSLCLQWIDKQVMTDLNVLDFGCGSGVLGIACALKGASNIICVDNDPQALEATLDNAERNQVSNRVHCLSPEAYHQGQVDVVLANILAKPLVDLKPELLKNLRPGGQIVLSGILESQVDMLVSAYQDSCEEISVNLQDGWARIAARVKRIKGD